MKEGEIKSVCVRERDRKKLKSNLKEILTLAEHELDKTMQNFFEMLFERLLTFATVQLRAQSSRSDHKLKHVSQTLHGLGQFFGLGGPVLGALLEHDEELVVGQGGVEVLVDVKLQDRNELLVSEIKM